MALMREYFLMDKEGNILDFAMSNRPSGPILNNIQYNDGKRWVPVEACPEDWVNDYFATKARAKSRSRA